MASGRGGFGNEKSANPFFMDDDIDDETFLAKKPPTSDWNSEGFDTDHEMQQKLQKMREIEERTLNSTHRSLQMVDESERVGLHTAEDLLHQKEQLENVDRKLDKMKQDTRISQRHITSIKSVFGGLKNYFSGNKDPKPEAPPKPESQSTSGLRTTVESNPRSSEHPAMRLRGLDDADEMAYPSQQQRPGRSAIDDEIDSNLGEMSEGMLRLRGLALGMQDEIDDQNEMLDKITNKTESADMEVARQNRQMKKILHK
ncbi:PREDICTED: synaptosomal-associated protein 29-like [Priapulus caudatus]|uniref:Synaptosomal-associated protein 29-like n=1 Tax=Priapulus caudatus TaxID=37621 RepID=A0ABM1EI19_PRICU|nr:PREDICTED: synaptosomal-associated protein 29-like [Priapulus caudatus]